MRITLLALCLATAPVFAAADCPPAHLFSPILDFYQSKIDTGFVVVGEAESVTVRFDQTVGVCFLGRVSGLGPGGTSLDMIDDFTVTGLADGTPLGLDATLAAYGNAPPSGPHGPGWTVVLGAGADSVVANHNNSNWTQTLTLPLSVTSGTPFRVHYRIEVLGDLDSFEQNGGGAIHFAGLPSGASIISCHGYHQNVPTTAHRASWGSVRARYR